MSGCPPPSEPGLRRHVARGVLKYAARGDSTTTSGGGVAVRGRQWGAAVGRGSASAVLHERSVLARGNNARRAVTVPNDDILQHKVCRLAGWVLGVVRHPSPYRQPDWRRRVSKRATAHSGVVELERRKREVGLRIIVFAADVRPLSSCRGPQAALKSSYRSDSVTRH